MSNSNKDIKQFVSNWNQICPIDRWWRNKHNIPFNSPAHRVSSFIDMYCEYMDDLLRKPSENKGRKEEFEYIPGKGNFMKKIIMTEEEANLEFENIDIDEMD